MGKSRLNTFLEQVENIDTARGTDEAHGRSGSLNRVEKRVEQELGFVLGEQVELVHDEHDRLRFVVAREKRPNQVLERIAERAEHFAAHTVA